MAFPGGHIEKGESEVQGVVREVREELGLDLNDSKSFAYIDKYPINIPFFYMKGD